MKYMIHEFTDMFICEYCGVHLLDLSSRDEVRAIFESTDRNSINFTFIDKVLNEKSPCITEEEFLIKKLIE